MSSQREFEIVTVRTGLQALFVAVPLDRQGGQCGAALLNPSTWDRPPYAGAMELVSLRVEEAWRRRGVGTALVRAAFAWSKAQGYPMTMVTAYALNAPAIAFYRSLGLHPHYITFDDFWRPEPMNEEQQ